MRLIIYTLMLCMLIIGCSDDKNESSTQVEKKEQITFSDNAKQTYTFEIKDDGVVKLESTPALKGMTIIAIFSKDCNMCNDILPHIANLTSRLDNVSALILRDEIPLKKNFLIPKNAKITELVGMDNALSFMLDSIKRSLNIEIRDYDEPLLLLLDSSGTILRSYEGAVIEEILEIDINEFNLKG